MLLRFRMAATLSIVTALWCWLLCSCYAIWKLGWIDGFLAVGEIPFNYSYPVTYLMFFVYSLGAFGVTFVAALALCMIAPARFRLAALCISWLIGTAFAAVDVSFMFLDHGGSTWAMHEAVRYKLYHPIATPFWVIFGLVGLASLTRALRRAP